MLENTLANDDDVHESDQFADILAGIEAMATRRPVAAQIVSVTSSDRADAKDLARVLMGDARLAGRVMKLANSAHFGMSGRVTSLQYAVAVVGFTTVRTLATVSLTESADDSALPDDFWNFGTGVALAAQRLAPRFAEFPPDALCLGLLTQIGAALLHHYDPAGYRQLVTQETDATRRRASETARYGTSSTKLSATALERWNFPAVMVLPLHRFDDRTSPRGGLLRASFEVMARLTDPDHERIPIGKLTCGMLSEPDLVPVMYDVKVEATVLRGMLLDE